jgi:hypothetical protein
MDNEHVVITHTTQRTPMREVRQLLRDALKPETYEKVIILMDRRRRSPQNRRS